MVSNEQMHILFFIAGYNEGTWSITNKPNQKPPQENTEPVVNIKQGPYLSVCYSKKVLSQQSRPLICSQTAAHAVCGEVCTSSGSSQSLSKVELKGSLPSARQNFPPSRLPAPGEGRRPVGSVPASAPRAQGSGTGTAYQEHRGRSCRGERRAGCTLHFGHQRQLLALQGSSWEPSSLPLPVDRSATATRKQGGFFGFFSFVFSVWLCLLLHYNESIVISSGIIFMS